MNAFAASLVFGTLTGLGNLLGGIIAALRVKRSDKALTYCLGLGGGFMLAAAFLEMVPESLEINPKWSPLLLLAGYLFIHFFEHTIGEHVHLGDHEHHGHEGLLHETVGLSTLFGIGVHTFFDGAAVGSGFHVSKVVGVLVFSAIVLHKIPEGFTVSSIILAAGRSRFEALSGSALIATATVLGAVCVGFGGNLLQLALPFSTGVMIYVAASDLIPEINEIRGFKIAAMVFVGVALFYLTRLMLQWVGI